MARATLAAVLSLLVNCTPTGSTPDSSPLVDETSSVVHTPATNPAKRVWVPDVSGRRLDAARRALLARGFVVEVRTRRGGLLVSLAQPRQVIGQHPGPFSRVREGRTVTIIVAVPPRQKSGCDPNYTGACLDPNAADYDCGGGDGNGPKYVWTTVRVVGVDHYGLDGNDDGWGCE